MVNGRRRFGRRFFKKFINTHHMGTEKKNGQKVESRIAKSLHKKFIRKCKKNETNMAQVIRDCIQGYVKR